MKMNKYTLESLLFYLGILHYKYITLPKKRIYLFFWQLYNWKEQRRIGKYMTNKWPDLR